MRGAAVCERAGHYWGRVNSLGFVFALAASSDAPKPDDVCVRCGVRRSSTKKANECPTCNRTLDAATNAESGADMPGPGDFSVCFYCGELLRFVDSGLRLASQLELVKELEPRQVATIRLLQARITSRGDL